MEEGSKFLGVALVIGAMGGDLALWFGHSWDLVGLGNGRNWDVPEARRDTGSNGNRGALQFYFNIMCFDGGDFGSREKGDGAGIARLSDGKEGCV